MCLAEHHKDHKLTRVGLIKFSFRLTVLLELFEFFWRFPMSMHFTSWCSCARNMYSANGTWTSSPSLYSSEGKQL